MKKAFSLIEVIFVLVILGIVASLSSQIIVQVYENYLTQRAVYNVSTKTELAINQIVNRLSYSIADSAIAKNPNDATQFKLLSNLNVATDGALTMLEWIGYDNDSFDSQAHPSWSGVADYETATKSLFNSPGSDLDEIDTVIKNLSNQEVSLTVPTDDHPAVVFQPRTGSNDVVNGTCMGLVNNDTSCIYMVSKSSTSEFSFDDTTKAKTISERYQFAWSAYALVPVQKANGLYDLNLYYNYQPWEGELYSSSTTYMSTLISNLSVFKFTQSGSVIQLKLCASEPIGQDFNVSACKEKVVIR